MQISLSCNKKSMQSFLGKINFVRRFILEFVEIVRLLQDVIKNNVDFKWNQVEREALSKIKEEIAKACILIYPNIK